jgi:hypothetical protein
VRVLLRLPPPPGTPLRRPARRIGSGPRRRPPKDHPTPTPPPTPVALIGVTAPNALSQTPNAQKIFFAASRPSPLGADLWLHGGIGADAPASWSGGGDDEVRGRVGGGVRSRRRQHAGTVPGASIGPVVVEKSSENDPTPKHPTPTPNARGRPCHHPAQTPNAQIDHPKTGTLGMSRVLVDALILAAQSARAPRCCSRRYG